MAISLRMLWLLLPFLFVACAGPQRISRSQKVDAAYLMGETGTYQKAWYLQQVFDPYNGGTYLPVDADRQETLLLFQDGGFLRYDPANYSEGQWNLSEDHERLALTYRMQNNQMVPPSKRDTLFRYQVLFQSQDSLNIAVQGRHGLVEYRYASQP